MKQESFSDMEYSCRKKKTRAFAGILQRGRGIGGSGRLRRNKISMRGRFSILPVLGQKRS